MATRVLTPQEYFEIYRNSVRSQDSDLTDFNQGSMLDILGGAFALAANELAELMLYEFRKTYIATAEGADLENLATDHFGPRFVRPQGSRATVELTFSRPEEGDPVTIPIDFVISTEQDANGETITFETLEQKTLIDTTATVQARAVDIGPSGNVAENKLTIMETSLTDQSVVVTNNEPAAGGSDAETDEEYRETIQKLITSLSGATKAALEGALLSSPSIRFVSLIERQLPAIEYDIGQGQIATDERGNQKRFFYLPEPIAYVADENGESSTEMIKEAIRIIAPVRACGVRITVLGATTSDVNFTAAIVLSATGPKRSELATNPEPIVETMRDFINKIPIGEGFSRSDASAFVIAVWGEQGTGDLAQFTVTEPRVNIAGKEGVKLLPGQVKIAL